MCLEEDQGSVKQMGFELCVGAEILPSTVLVTGQQHSFPMNMSRFAN